MSSSIHTRRGAGVRAAGWALAVLTGVAWSDARAQQPAAPQPAAPGAAWYSYVPGRGWAGYAPASATAASPGGLGARPAPGSPGTAPGLVTVPAPAPGWAGYAPASAWAGYAPASAPMRPAVRVAPSQMALPADGSRRRASGRFVNGNAPELSYTLPAYREFGSGRNIPLAKPWLPNSP